MKSSLSSIRFMKPSAVMTNFSTKGLVVKGMVISTVNEPVSTEFICSDTSTANVSPVPFCRTVRSNVLKSIPQVSVRE